MEASFEVHVPKKAGAAHGVCEPVYAQRFRHIQPRVEWRRGDAEFDAVPNVFNIEERCLRS